MDTFFITTAFIPRICFVILFGAAVGYLLSLKQKSAATWWLIGLCIALGLIDVAWDLNEVIPATRMSRTMYYVMFAIGQGFFVPIGLTFTQFAYTFRGNPYPKEARWLLAATSALTVLVLAVIVFTPAYLESSLLLVIQVAALSVTLLLCSWGTVVFIRKTIRFSRDAAALAAVSGPTVILQSAWGHLRAPQGRSARACRAFIGVALLLMLFLVGGLLVWGLQVFPEVGIQLFQVGYLLFIYGLLVAYVSYAPARTTVQVKLIGAALVTMLLFIVLISRMLFPVEVPQESDLILPEPQTLRFDPHEQGGFIATTHPLRFDPMLGDTLVMGSAASKALPLPFAFPYYGEVWNGLHLHANGLVSFGGSLGASLDFSSWPYFHSRPLIAPMGGDLGAAVGGTVYFKATAEAATVTWHEIPRRDAAAVYSVQLVLYPTGAIAFNYEGFGGELVGVDRWYVGMRGLHPGGPKAPIQVLPRTLDGPVQSAAGFALAEDYAMQLYGHLETKGLPLFYIIVATTLFIFFIFPYVFRNNLLKPLERLLEGVRRVEAGDTDTVVAVDVQDEIGDLTQHFNGMAYAVREAEAKLQAYAETLEEQVEARTAELAQSLDDLKAAQAQLVQSEKMASLGQLTAGIAHEIKNPLNFVNNFALLSTELAADLAQQIEAHKQRLPAEVSADLEEMLDDLVLNTEKIHHHGQRADGIVQSMLEHSRLGEGARERRLAAVNALVEEYVSLAYHGMRASVPGFNVSVVRDYDETVGAIEMVPQEIGRVFINLLNNAFDAVRERAHQSNGQYAPTVAVSTQQREGEVVIRVSDNGPGIPESLRAKVFEPFFTTKPTGQGTGLGLSLSYDIITQGHGGTMAVESMTGKGATFIVTMPNG